MLKKQTLLTGTLVLMVASIINRLIGFVYQIVLVRLVTAEGIGLFNIAFPIYILVLVMASAGIPLALAKLIAEEAGRQNYALCRRMFRFSLLLTIATSLFCTLLLWLALPWLMQSIIPNPDVYYCLTALIPSIIICSVSSVFRSYFQGLQQMTPTAVAQIVEQSVRVLIGIAVTASLLPNGISQAAVGISLGVVSGEIAGFLTMLLIYYRNRGQLVLSIPKTTSADFAASASFSSILRRILQLAVPVTLTRIASSLVGSLEGLLIPARLGLGGHSDSQAAALYGELAGIAEPLLYTPSMVTMSMATAIIPAISEAAASHNLVQIRRLINESLRITFLVGCPCTMILLLLPLEICSTVFGNPEAGTILFVLALSAPFLYLAQITIGILQGLGHVSVPFKNLMLASVVKIALLYYLTALPQFNIVGTAIAFGLNNLIFSLLNYRDLRRLTGIRPELRRVALKPGLAAAAAGALLWLLKAPVAWLIANSWLCLLCQLTLGGGIYLLLLIIVKGITADDTALLKNLIIRIK